ncbi:hypothetical protein EDEG_03911 [Edhazardia aedis USNM 41457]|uniref:Uncharacterized protein n=1 Tax=Edhazardia aedis (strain USNM 41457) TaxID=1003232 RepID=J9D0W3_EDHAE|nr:hypothetical protein EDEG_03911 [Edhazardia aedis USNM 41457]|eukprot:EJW01506.1 hypothetical protein EDEG_03911 [Edhazardia aedis USNM 41457]
MTALETSVNFLNVQNTGVLQIKVKNRLLDQFIDLINMCKDSFLFHFNKQKLIELSLKNSKQLHEFFSEFKYLHKSNKKRICWITEDGIEILETANNVYKNLNILDKESYKKYINLLRKQKKYHPE